MALTSVTYVQENATNSSKILIMTRGQNVGILRNILFLILSIQAWAILYEATMY